MVYPIFFIGDSITLFAFLVYLYFAHLSFYLQPFERYPGFVTIPLPEIFWNDKRNSLSRSCDFSAIEFLIRSPLTIYDILLPFERVDICQQLPLIVENCKEYSHRSLLPRPCSFCASHVDFCQKSRYQPATMGKRSERKNALISLAIAKNAGSVSFDFRALIS